MASTIARKASKYKRVGTSLFEGQAHKLDPFTPAPQILYVGFLETQSPHLQPTQKSSAEKNPEDVSDFPRQLTIPIPEARPYDEGSYRPASVPINAGYWPYNVYLQQGKVNHIL